MKTLKSFFMVVAMMTVMMLCGGQQAKAQFGLGIKVAGNFTSLDKFDIHNMNAGFDLGVFCRVGDRFFFQPEVNYSFRSADFQNIIGEFRENYDMRQHFIDVPLLLGYNIVNKDNFRFHIFVGPRGALLIDNQLMESHTFDDVCGRMQWGGQVGIGFDIWRFTIDGRYDLSADRTSTSDNSSRVQNMFIVSLGFKILK